MRLTTGGAVSIAQTAVGDGVRRIHFPYITRHFSFVIDGAAQFFGNDK
jgi:hypothetical protein